MESQFHTTGSLVWIWTDNDKGWVKGTVQKVERDGKLQVRLGTGSIGNYKPDDCPLRNVESRMGVEVGFNEKRWSPCKLSLECQLAIP